MEYEIALKALYGARAAASLASLYGGKELSRERYARLIKIHRDTFSSDGSLCLICAPGRAELIGNHTDHNRGLVLAAAVNLDIAAAVTRRDDMKVNLISQGYQPLSLSLDSLRPVPSEEGTSASLIRGVAAGMVDRGCLIGGFDAVMTSDVLSGSGLSSSAAFEVLVCAVFDALYNDLKVDPKTRAKIGQYAENAFFGKPSGLMDQMASSCGGIVAIDFMEEDPQVQALNFSFTKAGYDVIVVNTGSSHDDLTKAYAEIPADMKAAAKALGGRLLRDSSYERLLAALPQVRRQAGDRAALRAMHYYQENERVRQAVKALQAADIGSFLKEVNASGISSWTLLQNIYAVNGEQPMSLALARAQGILKGRGACRVHGGGFAGTTLNFVPQGLSKEFMNGMEALFGKGCCHMLDVRQEGPVCILPA